MTTQLLYLRDLPRHEHIRAAARRYHEVDPETISSYLLLLRVASDIGTCIHGYLEEHGISHGRFTVLMILNRQPDEGVSPAELADKAGVTRATMTGLLDGLERDGLVARQGHAEDRRMLLVFLTTRGKQFLASTVPGYFKRIAELMKPLSSREKQSLGELLGKLGAQVAPSDASPGSK